MEQFTDSFNLLDMNQQPSFLVKDGIIIKTNAAAAGYMIETGVPIRDLLLTGEAEYDTLEGGCLYLRLSAAGQTLGASVVRLQGFDAFVIDQNDDNRKLQAMALAAVELRGPLSNIMDTAKRLFPAMALDDDPATRDQVSRINHGLFQLLRIINNMSDADRYSKNTATGQKIQNICEVLDEIFRRAKDLSDHTGVTLKYDGIPEPIYTFLDAEKLEGAILNIISNSIKFTPKGGSIHASLTRRGNRLYLSIRDTGCGIPTDKLRTIYSGYARTPKLEEGRHGIGLGMVLIRSAAALHGGTVLIDNCEAGGTRIVMSLAIRTDSSSFQSPRQQVDYSGGWDPTLIALSEILPSELYMSPIE